MIDNAPLLTARELVAELARLGAGNWGADAVRQWIREQPACPIAQPAQQGAPHRYQVGEVLPWLRQRAARERNKGFAPADGVRAIDRLDQALALHQAGGPAAMQPPSVASTPVLGPSTTLPSAPKGAGDLFAQAPVQPSAQPPIDVSPAKGNITGDDVEKLNDVELLLEVLKGRDARSWKAAEEAMQIRAKRLVELRRLIPAEEFELAVQSMITLLISGLSILPNQVADQIPDESSRPMRLTIAQQLCDALRERLARSEIRDA